METSLSKTLVSRKALPKTLLCALGLLLLASGTLAPAAWGQNRYANRQAAGEAPPMESVPVAARVSAPGHDEARPPASQRAPEALRQVLSLRVEGATLAEAVRRIAEEGDLDLIYGSHPVLTRKTVTLRLEDVTAVEALESVLRGSGLEMAFSRSGRLILVKTGVSKVPPLSLKGTSSGPALMQKAKAAALGPGGPARAPVQTGTIAGTVTDGGSGNPLPGVNVTLEGTQRGAATGAEGQYEITGVEVGTYTVQASFIGYGDETRESVDVQEGQTTTVDFALRAQAQSLDEVVAIGYGEQQRRDLTGAVASVEVDSVRANPVISADRMLQGRVAGAHVVRGNGAPGGGVSVRIRGTNSITANSEPLYVVDGVPLFTGSGSSFPDSNPLASVSAGDIASIEVLKDASATAIYGSRGANGVVLITTKQGRRNENIVQFEANYGSQSPARELSLLNARQYAQLRREARINSGLDPQMTQEEIESLGEGTDWQDRVFRSAPTQNYSLSLSGGDDKTQYRISGSLFDQQGILINSGYRRYSARVNLNRDMNEAFRVGSRLYFSQESRNSSNTDYAPQSGVTGGALTFSPISPVKHEDGSYVLFNPLGLPNPNPVATALELENPSTTSNLTGRVFSEYDITDALQLNVSFEGNANFGRNEYYAPSTIIQGSPSSGDARVSSSRSSNLIGETLLKYERSLWEGHNLDLTAGLTGNVFRSEWVQGQAQEFATDVTGANSLGAGALYLAPGSSVNEWTLLSGLGRANYRIADKYLFTLTGRYDGSSKFGEENKWGFFPSGAFAWRFSEEPFLKEADWLNDAKVRLSYGVTGNQEIGTYQSLARLTDVSHVFGTTQVVGYVPAGRAPNPNLKWERSRQFNAAVDLGLWKNRITFTAGIYNTFTDDLLLSVPLPDLSGYSSQLQNVGSMRNRGVEFAVSTVNMSQPGFSWETTVNLSRNRNEVANLFEDVKRIFPAAQNRNALAFEERATSIVQVGQPVGVFFGYQTDGIWQQDEASRAAEFDAVPGDRKYVDANGDGIITPADRTIVGNPHPDFHGGIRNEFTLGPFSLDVFFQGSYGKEIANTTKAVLTTTSAWTNQLESTLNRWQPGNPSNEIPRAVVSRERHFIDDHVEDGSYLRLKNVSLGYRLPQGVLPGVEQARIHVSGQNLWTWTSYSGYDPEINSYGGNSVLRGVDMSAYPRARTVNAGVSLTF